MPEKLSPEGHYSGSRVYASFVKQGRLQRPGLDPDLGQYGSFIVTDQEMPLKRHKPRCLLFEVCDENNLFLYFKEKEPEPDGVTQYRGYEVHSAEVLDDCLWRVLSDEESKIQIKKETSAPI